MKQSLQLKLGQQLTMTPQLQQAIRLLQLSTMDLQQEIQLALDSNPMLEMADENNDPSEQFSLREDRAEGEQGGADAPLETVEYGTAELPDNDADWTAGLAEELPVDTQWDDLLPGASASSFSGDDLEDTGFENSNPATDSLREQLLWQLNLTRLSDVDRLIALAIIDATDDNGRVTQDLEDIARPCHRRWTSRSSSTRWSRYCTGCSNSNPPAYALATCRSACWCSCSNYPPQLRGWSRPEWS
jgi:RNA polymerase sigma-54 factor